MRYIISAALASLLTLTPAQAEVPRVVTDMSPIGALVAQVMGDLGEPVVLLDAGADAHAFQLRPSQAADLAAARAVIWLGPEMTPWLGRAMQGVNTGTVDLRLLAVAGVTLQAYGAAHGESDHGGHDHAAKTADAHDDHDHATGDIDPHAWLDPANADLWLGTIAAALGTLDPANAVTYAANATAAQADLKLLDAEIAARLAPAKETPLVVFHNAYGYFAAHYGLTVAGAIADGDAASPGAAHLRDLQTTLEKTPACLFPEANHDPKLLTALSEIPGIRLGGTLDPEGASLSQGPALYGDLLRGLADTIAACAAR